MTENKMTSLGIIQKRWLLEAQEKKVVNQFILE